METWLSYWLFLQRFCIVPLLPLHDRWDETTLQISTYISFIILRLLRWNINNYELISC